jgi:hypothetical protein
MVAGERIPLSLAPLMPSRPLVAGERNPLPLALAVEVLVTATAPAVIAGEQTPLSLWGVEMPAVAAASLPVAAGERIPLPLALVPGMTCTAVGVLSGAGYVAITAKSV